MYEELAITTYNLHGYVSTRELEFKTTLRVILNTMSKRSKDSIGVASASLTNNKKKGETFTMAFDLVISASEKEYYKKFCETLDIIPTSFDSFVTGTTTEFSKIDEGKYQARVKIDCLEKNV